MLLERGRYSKFNSLQPLSLLSNVSLNLNNSKPLARRSWPDAWWRAHRVPRRHAEGVKWEEGRRTANRGACRHTRSSQRAHLLQLYEVGDVWVYVSQTDQEVAMGDRNRWCLCMRMFCTFNKIWKGWNCGQDLPFNISLQFICMCRSFALPDDAKEEGITAKLTNGVLTVDV